MGTTHRLATHGEEVIMKFFAVLPSLLAAVSAEAFLPISAQALPAAGLYAGNVGLAAPYAPAYANVEARFAYNQPITAINAGPLTAGPVAAAVPAYTAAAPAAAVPAYTAAAPVIGAQYAAAYSAPAITAPVAAGAYYGAAAPAAYGAAAPVAYGAAAPVVAAAPAAYAAAPVVAAAPTIAAPSVTSSQFQAQDEIGNIAYGYQNINSAKQERGNVNGGVEGSYTYVDEAGSHTVNYIADDYGFRVTSDNLPVAPVHAAVAPVYNGVAPVAVVDTPEVAEARAAFLATYDAAVQREKRSAQYLPAAPVAAYAAAPAGAPSREAILTTIKLNPGHAIFYRVD